MAEDRVKDLKEEVDGQLPARSTYADFPGRTISSLGRTLGSVLDVGRELLARRRASNPALPKSSASLIALCKDLLDHRGEASGLALASEVAMGYQQLPESQRQALPAWRWTLKSIVPRSWRPLNAIARMGDWKICGPLITRLRHRDRNCFVGSIWRPRELARW
ncbi:MAG: hypothetical protein R3E64_10900 [Halioglobus sp.]